VDGRLLARRDKVAARAYSEKSIDQNGEPEIVTIDKSGSNMAALQTTINAKRKTPIKVRQKKYLNNIVEQDHRAIKRRTRPMMGSRIFVAHASFWAELRHAYDSKRSDERRP
jgi:transposase-like protein